MVVWYFDCRRGMATEAAEEAVRLRRLQLDRRHNPISNPNSREGGHRLATGHVLRCALASPCVRVLPRTVGLVDERRLVVQVTHRALIGHGRLVPLRADARGHRASIVAPCRTRRAARKTCPPRCSTEHSPPQRKGCKSPLACQRTMPSCSPRTLGPLRCESDVGELNGVRCRRRPRASRGCPGSSQTGAAAARTRATRCIARTSRAIPR